MKKRITYEPGMRFGRLVLVERAEDQVSANGKHKTVWLCKCDCGNYKKVTVSHLGDGHTLSCGCLNSELSKQRYMDRHFIHGYSEHPIYITYKHMIDRCYKPNTKNYSLYGGRGIEICDEWFDPTNFNNPEKFKNFFNWSIINGFAPGLQIDRIDPNGNYCPENCRWANKLTQANNKRVTRYVEFNGEMYPISSLAYILGVNPQDFYDWLYYRDFNINALTKVINTPYGPHRVLVDRNGNIVPTNALWFISKTGEFISQNDYTDPEPIPALYVMDQRGFITGPMI